MSARRSRFLAFESLSPEAQSIVVEAIEADATQEEIRRRVKAHGEEFSKGACSRFVRTWYMARAQEKAADQQTERLVKALRENDVESEQIAKAVVKMGLFENMDEAGDLKLPELMKLQLRQKELEIKQATLELGSERIKLLERDLKLREDKLRRIREQAKRVEKSVEKLKDLPPKVIADLRSLYGLAQEEAAA